MVVEPPRCRSRITSTGIPMAADAGPDFPIPDIVIFNRHPVAAKIS